ncbi:MAG: class II fructose-bisphosphate aldolase [Candidatus Colwellbacteria bacterium]|nr:class II fructose-bisphosphate aldolase [Candidatus Colwellbacteria bacterium]
MAPLLYRFIKEAEDKRVAVGHFNISDIVALKAIAGAARDIYDRYHIIAPVIIGLSEGEADFVGLENAVSLVNNLRTGGIPAFLNADHIHSLERLETAVRLGFDSAVFDVSDRPFDENIRLTREAVQLAKSINPSFIVEGEIGHIGGASKVLEEIPADAVIDASLLSRPEEAVRFMAETGVDMITPAVGNIHGILKNFPNPRLDIDRINEIHKAVPAPLVLHGGSGIRDEDFLRAIYAGISVIHINTELRIAWRRGVESGLAQNPDEVAPYKILPLAEKAIRSVVFERLKLFNKLV